jgi:Flp pilus assembly pilin Flp
MRSVVNTKRQHGAQVVEYCLLIAVVSISLTLGLSRLGNGVCELNNRVGGLLGSAAVSCGNSGSGNSGGGNNGGGNNTGNGNNGGGNNSGGGTNGGGNNNGGGQGPGGNGRGGGVGPP